MQGSGGLYAPMPEIIEQPLGEAGQGAGGEWEESYQPLPSLFLGLFFMWAALAVVWITNTWMKRRWQSSNLQWALATVPLLKAVVLGLSFIFWYSCLHLSTCSFWVAFGVFVARIFFETTCFVALLLIAHGYCLTQEQLAAPQRRSIAGLASLLYLTLTGYKAAVPTFSILVAVVYTLLLYVIFSHAARNVGLLWEQLASVEEDSTPEIRTVLQAKYGMFRRYQGALLVLVLLEIMIHVRADGVASKYWKRLLFREYTEAIVFCFIGWTFRSRKLSPFFSVFPAVAAGVRYHLPPIHRVEMDEKQFRGLEFKQWQIGVPSTPAAGASSPVLVIIQNPGREWPSASAASPSKAGYNKTALSEGIRVQPIALTGPIVDVPTDTRTTPGGATLGHARNSSTSTPAGGVVGGVGLETGWDGKERTDAAETRENNEPNHGQLSSVPGGALAGATSDGASPVPKAKPGADSSDLDRQSTLTPRRALFQAFTSPSTRASSVYREQQTERQARPKSEDGRARREASPEVVVEVMEPRAGGSGGPAYE